MIKNKFRILFDFNTNYIFDIIRSSCYTYVISTFFQIPSTQLFIPKCPVINRKFHFNHFGLT